MNKFEKFFNEHMDEFFSIKNLIIGFLSVITIMLLIGANHVVHHSNNAHDYIKLLEEHIGNDDMNDVISETDAYCEYYDY